jgi:hypothetical protein
MRPSTALQQAVTHARKLAILALVPFLVAVLRWRDLVRTGTDPSTVFSITFPTPHSFISLWSFVNAPTGVGDGVGGGTLPVIIGVSLGALFLVSLAAYVVISGAVLAGYLGSIADGIATGSFDFVANVRRYARPMIAYEALMILALLGFILGLASIPVLFPIVAIGLFVLAYLTYLTPYLVVVVDLGIVEAFKRSVELTTQRSEAGVAFVGFVIVGALLSVPLSALAYGNGIAGAVVAAGLAAPVGLVASVAFVVFTRGLTGVARDPAW